MSIAYNDPLWRRNRAGLTSDDVWAWLTPTGVPGVVGQRHDFHAVLEGLSSAFDREFGAASEYLRFPPVMARAELDRIGYFRNFPNFLGSVHCFCGDEIAHQRLLESKDADLTALDRPTDLVLTPAACYPVYPTVAARGAVPADGLRMQVRSHCFRREPSDDPARLQSFQMQEIIRIGTKDQAAEFHAATMPQAEDFFRSLELPAELVEANDPFFGRTAGVMKKGQRAQNLKYELVVQINAVGPPTACMSFNLHRDHFAKSLSLETENGELAHTSCLGIGLERTTLALFRWHGANPADWPNAIRKALALS